MYIIYIYIYIYIYTHIYIYILYIYIYFKKAKITIVLKFYGITFCSWALEKHYWNPTQNLVVIRKIVQISQKLQF